jgi:hypothetical protein
MISKFRLVGLLSAAALFTPAAQALDVTVSAAGLANGFMNVFELPSNGGGYVFGSSWGVADLAASFSGDTVTFGVNSVNDPSSFWYTPSGGPGAAGNKTMEANLYGQYDDVLAGQTLIFSGTVVSNTLDGAHAAFIFIRDFAPDFSSNVSSVIPLTPGDFSLSLALLDEPGRHVQYGITVTGPNVWITEAPAAGAVVVGPAAIPEPSSYALLGGAAIGLLTVGLRRRR